MTLEPALVDAILERLGVARPIAVDLDGLARLYAAWCQAVPFDNVQKLVHLASGAGAPLPGSTATDFFTAWLATGAGGTCWAGNGALHDLCAALGFPGIVLDPQGGDVPGLVFTSDALGVHWARLDAFEGEGYVRVLANVRLDEGRRVEAYVYALRDTDAGTAG